MNLRFITAVILLAFMNSTPAATYTYENASEEMYAFELFNSERAHCGFGTLKQSVALDSAAKAHANWLFINKRTGHIQVPHTPEFTGVAPWDRVVVSTYGPDYSFESTEVQVFHSGMEKGAAAAAVRSLLNAPYHMLQMLRGWREIGIGVIAHVDLGLVNTNQNILNIDLASKNSEGMQIKKTDSVRTYPCEGSIGVTRSLHSETPNPFLGRDLFAKPVGTSIGVVGDVGGILTLSSSSIVNAITGARVTVLAPVSGSTSEMGTPEEDKLVKSNETFISTDSPLEANTPYQVTITGTTDRVAFSRSFTFVTER